MSTPEQNADYINQLMLQVEMANAQAMAATRGSARQFSDQVNALLTPSVRELDEMARRVEAQNSSSLSQHLDALLLPSKQAIEMMAQNAEATAARQFSQRSNELFANISLADAAEHQAKHSYESSSITPTVDNTNRLFKLKSVSTVVPSNDDSNSISNTVAASAA